MLIHPLRRAMRAYAFAILGLSPLSAQVVISQIYGAGGNSGAVLRNDYVELFNAGTEAQSLAGWSVQYASSTGPTAGNTFLVTTLSGSIGPKQYYLVQLASGGANGNVLPVTPDASGTTNISATSGKLALVSSTTALTSSTASSGNGIVDFVGYGSGISASEGNAAAPGPSTTTATFRLNNGCTDTNNNGADFLTGTPAPRNSATPAITCTSVPPPVISQRRISEIQGSGSVSPLAGQTVQTLGIVTGIRSNGFFLQTSPAISDPLGQPDSDAATSEGLLVFTSSTPPAAAALGNLVSVTGTVAEFVPAADPNSPPETELVSPIVTLLSTGNALPAPVTLTVADTNPGGSIEQLERYEGMRVRVDSLTAVAPTSGTVNEASATASSNGVFYGVISGVPRPFREPGIETPDPLPNPPCCIPRFDANPERLRINSRGQTGSTGVDVTAGTVLTNVVGVLDYAFRAYTILTDAATPPGAGALLSAVPVPTPGANEFTVGSFNLERFFDTSNDQSTSDATLTPAAFNNRLNKASLAIRNVLMTPDIIGVVEMENLPTLQALAAKINSDAAAAGQANPSYQAFLVEGNDIGGIDVGLLVKSTRVTVVDVTQVNKTATYTNPNTGNQSLVFDRPPLVLRATIGPQAFPVTVIVNHLLSLTSEDDPSDGARVRAKKAAQAEVTANLIQSRQALGENVVAVGDFNAFQFNDGYVDPIGTLLGQPTPSNQVLVASPDLVNPDLTDLISTLPSDQRYTYSFDGNAQALDHVLVSANLLPRVTRFAVARVDADFPEVFRNDPNRPERVSDHDAPVAYFSLPASGTVDVSAQVRFSLSGLIFNRATQTFNGTVSITNTGAAISGPLQFLLQDLTPGIALSNASGAYTGSPYLTVPGGNRIGAGETVTLTVRFTNPSLAALSYTPKLFSGSF